MPYMTTYDSGDAVLVGFPFTNLQTTKNGPPSLSVMPAISKTGLMLS
ncbi:MAG: hypothetical protein ACI9Y1_003701 [Lentisphaeria bacterium]|jgi:hypothetical protein